jgi:hypothetical protein
MPYYPAFPGNSVTIANPNDGQSLTLRPTGDTGNSSSTGGAINLDLSNSTNGAGLTVYSTKSTTTGHLSQFRTTSDTFNQHAMFVDYKGNTNAVNFKYTSPASTVVSASAFNMSSDNENGSAIQVRGKEKALGSLKLTHENPSTSDGTYDLNAAALSVDVVENTGASGIGTAAQGVSINSTTGTTGKLLRVRNSSTDKFSVDTNGIYAHSNRIQNVLDPTSAQDAATKNYVDNYADWVPVDYAFKSWSYDIAQTVNNTAPTAGVLQVVKLKTPGAISITNMYLLVANTPATVANAYVAIYQNGSLIAQSADLSSSFGASGIKTLPVSASVAAGKFDAVFWFGSAGTMPTIARASGTGGNSGGLTGTNLRFSTADTGITTTAPPSLGARTTSVNTYWVAVS